MENQYISPVQIPHLVRLTADLFNTLNKEVQAMHTSPQKAIQVNFVVDLLKDFTDIAYPIEKNISSRPSIQKNARANGINNGVVKEEPKDKTFFIDISGGNYPKEMEKMIYESLKKAQAGEI